MSHRKNEEILKAIGRGLKQVPELNSEPPPSIDIELRLKILKYVASAHANAPRAQVRSAGVTGPASMSPLSAKRRRTE